MLRMTPTAQVRCRKVSWYSHASMTALGPLPALPYPPMSGSLPPMTAAGSRPASSSMVVIMPEVVVLPWVPATPTVCECMRLT